jgi:hypothetical protein
MEKSTQENINKNPRLLPWVNHKGGSTISFHLSLLSFH